MKYFYNSRYTAAFFSLSAAVCMVGGCPTGSKKQTLSQRLEAVSQGKLKNSIIQHIKQNIPQSMNEQTSKEGMEKLPKEFRELLESTNKTLIDNLITTSIMPKIDKFIKSFQEICRAELSPQKLECVIGKLEQLQQPKFENMFELEHLKFENMFETFKEVVPEHVNSKVENDFSMISDEVRQNFLKYFNLNNPELAAQLPQGGEVDIQLGVSQPGGNTA